MKKSIWRLRASCMSEISTEVVCSIEIERNEFRQHCNILLIFLSHFIVFFLILREKWWTHRKVELINIFQFFQCIFDIGSRIDILEFSFDKEILFSLWIFFGSLYWKMKKFGYTYRHLRNSSISLSSEKKYIIEKFENATISNSNFSLSNKFL